MEYPHVPVMPEEVVENLITAVEGIYVDGTMGAGGHSELIAKRLGHEGRLISLDCDKEAVTIAEKRLSGFGEKVTVIHRSYAELDSVIRELGLNRIQGAMLDLGMSSFQLDLAGRGFSFNRNEPLDMRMDPGRDLTAEGILNNYSVKEIETILRGYGEERRARSIAKAIVNERRSKPFVETMQLVKLIQRMVPVRRVPGAKHPATRAFQALRIAVNGELENLKSFLEKLPSLLTLGGHLVILSYHSLEDRIVKQTMVKWERGCDCPPDFPQCVCGKKPLFKRISRKGIRPGRNEIEDNPRARSAIMRVAERI